MLFLLPSEKIRWETDESTRCMSESQRVHILDICFDLIPLLCLPMATYSTHRGAASTPSFVQHPSDVSTCNPTQAIPQIGFEACRPAPGSGSGPRSTLKEVGKKQLSRRKKVIDQFANLLPGNRMLGGDKIPRFRFIFIQDFQPFQTILL